MLRDYQVKAVDEIRKHFKLGRKKVLLHMATGAGKTVIFSHIMKSTALKGKRVGMIVRGRKLVDQCHKRLQRENVPHGVMMAGHWNYKPNEPIQICSVDTLRSRGLYPPFDLIVLDEAHFAISKTYKDFISQYPNAYLLPVTATPYTEQSLTHIADVVVKPISFQQLVDEGYLVPPVYFAPSPVDVSNVGVSRSTKDYIVAELEDIINQNKIVGDLVQTWKKFAENRPTLIFAVSIKHSRHIEQMFNEAGIKTLHCDADSSDDERDGAIRLLEEGHIQCITNVGIFCTGVDIPKVSCIVMARPTKSYNLYVQQAGRGSRVSKGKDNFLVLDNAGNVLRHGFIQDEREVDLNGKEKQEIVQIKICEVCYGAFRRNESKCPHCGAEKTQAEKEREIKEEAGELARIERENHLTEFKRLQRVRKEKQFKRGWIYHQMKAKFGYKIAEIYCPKRTVPEWVKRTRT